MSTITLIGAGQMASALTFPLYENGHEVRLVGSPLDDQVIDRLREDNYHVNLLRTLHDGIHYYKESEKEEAIQGADLIVCGVSSFGVDWFAENILPKVPETLPVLSITKGMQDLEDGTMISFPHLYAERLGDKKLCLNAVGGPCTSYELADHDPTLVAFCGPDIEVLRRLKAIFETDYYHICLSTDVTGVECAVAMKNAYALAVSLAVGLSERIEGVGGTLHYNSQAALFAQSIREMRRLLKLIGGHDDNIVYGVGDLYVTIFGGRTRKIGTLLGRGVSFDDAMAQLSGITLESVVISTRTARAVRKLIERGLTTADDFPLLLHIDDIINHGAEVNIPWEKFEMETVL